MTWDDDQAWEIGWWGDCINTFGEETKQITYASRMGVPLVDDGSGKWPIYDARGASVADIGGGPVSMLLKAAHLSESQPSVVVDPGKYPDWTADRYAAAGVDLDRSAGEDFTPEVDYDEAWIYNCLQHTQDPERIVANARAASRTIRIFEWINLPPSLGHPQTLTEPDLNRWLGGSGKCEYMNENGCIGLAYFGVFDS